MSAQTDPARVDAALITVIRERMPSVEQLNGLVADPSLPMGPDVTLPAVWVHLLALSLEVANVEARLATSIPATFHELNQRFRATDPGMSFVDDDDEAEFASTLAKIALQFAVKPELAVLVLLRAAGAVAISRLPSSLAAPAIEKAAQMAADQVRQVLGQGATRQ